MLGQTEFSLAVAASATRESVLSLWERFALPLVSRGAAGGGKLPDRGSLLDVRGAELSSVRRVNGRLQARVWNPSMQPRLSRIGDRRVDLGPGRIATVELES
jgi:hypothetical protein